MSPLQKQLFSLDIFLKDIKIKQKSLLTSFTFDPVTTQKVSTIAKTEFAGKVFEIDCISRLVTDNDELNEEYEFGSSCLFCSTLKSISKEIQRPIYLDLFCCFEQAPSILLGRTKLSFDQDLVNSFEFGQFPSSVKLISECYVKDVFDQDRGTIMIGIELTRYGSYIVNDIENFIHINKNTEKQLSKKDENEPFII